MCPSLLEIWQLVFCYSYTRKLIEQEPQPNPIHQYASSKLASACQYSSTS